LRVVGEADVEHAVWDCGCGCGRGSGKVRGRGGGDWDEGGVVDAVAVYFADVEIGFYGFYVGVGDVVGGAVDGGGWFCGLGFIGLVRGWLGEEE